MLIAIAFFYNGCMQHIPPKRQPVVHMSLAGDVTVIERIQKKKKLLESGNSYHEEIRPLLLLPPGAMRGAIQAGVAVGLEKMDIIKTFDTVVGISAGAAVAYYTFAGQAAIGSTVIFEDMVDMKFINYLRPRNIVNVEGFEKVLRDQKPIDVGALRDFRTNVVVGVTNYMTGVGEFIEIQKTPDPLAGVIASICIPVVSGKTVILEGKNFVDGSIAHPMPLSYAIEKYNPTDILVVANKSLKEEAPFSGLSAALMNRILPHTIPQLLHDAILNMYERENQELSYLTYHKKAPNGARILTIYPQASKIDMLTMDRQLLEGGILDAAAFTENLFAPVE